MLLKWFLWWCSSGTYVVFLFSHFNSVPFVSALLLTQTAHLQYTMATLNTLAVCPLSQLPFVCPAPTLISLKHHGCDITWKRIVLKLMFSGEKPAELHLEQTGGVLSLKLSGNCHNLFQSIKIFKILLSKELSAQWKIYWLKHLTKFVTKLSRPCMGSHSGFNLCEFTLPGPGRLLKSSNRN